MKKHLLSFVILSCLPIFAHVEEEPLKYLNQLIFKEIELQAKMFKEAQGAQSEDEYMEYSEASYQSQLKLLYSLLKSIDIELKKNYFLAQFISECEFEKSTLVSMGDMMESSEKIEVHQVIKGLEPKIRILEKF